MLCGIRISSSSWDHPGSTGMSCLGASFLPLALKPQPRSQNPWQTLLAGSLAQTLRLRIPMRPCPQLALAVATVAAFRLLSSSSCNSRNKLARGQACMLNLALMTVLLLQAWAKSRLRNKAKTRRVMSTVSSSKRNRPVLDANRANATGT